MDEEGIFGDYEDVYEKGAYDRMTDVDKLDRKNPKDVLIFNLNNEAFCFGIDEDQLEKIKSTYISEFTNLEYQNYNAKGLLLGYVLYKSKVSNKKEFMEIYNKYKDCSDASVCDAIRYMRLWKLYLRKIQK